MTRQLLGFSRSLYQIETLSVNELIAEVLKLISRSINKNVVVKQRLFFHLLPIDADATQIQQIILNLCLEANDARRATEGG